MTLHLPWPPSVNSYYRRVGNRTLVSRAGRAYKTTVAAACLEQHAKHYQGHRLSVTATAYPPDKRARDLDNLWKCLLDSLEAAGVIDNDAHIDHLAITRANPTKPGHVEITVEATHAC